MPDAIVALIIPLAAVAIIFTWVPLLNLICPPCTRALEQQRIQMKALKMLASTASIRD
jgi:hypothetical protein